MVLYPRYRGNASHAGLTVNYKYHKTSSTFWSPNTAQRSLCPASNILSTRSKILPRFVFYVFKQPSEEPSLVDVLHDMMGIRQRLALAEHICQCTQHHPFRPQLDYAPLELPIGTSSYLECEYHMHPAQIKQFAFTAQHTHPVLPLLTHAPSLQRITAYHHQHQPPLYQQVIAYAPQSSTVAPPTHVLRFLCTALQAVNIWTDVSALAREPYHTSQRQSQWNDTISHTSHIGLSAPDTSPAYHSHITSRSWVFRDTALPPHHPPPPIAYARFKSILWYLYASPKTV